ncbi:hypothetical protein [Nocardia sp. NPDC050789]
MGRRTRIVVFDGGWLEVADSGEDTESSFGVYLELFRSDKDEAPS